MNNNEGQLNLRFRRWPLPVLLLLLLAFFLPLLAGWEKFFYDDIAFMFYPQQVFLSRALGRGIIPWWNPHLAAGACPFYAYLFQSAMSPVNWVFLLLGALDPSRNFFWLIKLPVAFSFLLAAVFSYLFARRGLRLGAGGAFVTALAYTLSPAMIYFSTSPPEVQIQAWIPFVCLCLLRFTSSGRPVWLILGALAFAVVSPAGDFPVLFHLLFIAALFGAGLLVICLRRGDRRSIARLAVGAAVIFVVGGLLAGPYWANSIDGVRMLSADTGEVVEDLSGSGQSLPPAYLITLFIPDYFGGVTSHHSWGAAHLLMVTLNDVNILGGLALLFLAFAGFLSPSGRDREPGPRPSPREYWWLFFGIFVFGLLVVLGRYTPAYGFFRRFIPVLQMPYPVRFRSVPCFALAGLAGVSAELLRRNPLPRPARAAAIYLAFVIGLAGLVLFLPYFNVRGRLFSPGFRQLTEFGDWSWFLRGPALHLALGAVFLLAVSIFAGRRRFLPLLIVLTAAELFFFSYRAFYHNRVLNHRFEDLAVDRYRGPDQSPHFQRLAGWRPEREGEWGLYRRLIYRSHFANVVWRDGALATLGFDIKPLDSRFTEVVEQLTQGFPYEMRVRVWSSRFWLNMSARYFFAERPLKLPRVAYQGIRDGYYRYEALDALPRFYFQDRWIEVEPDRERDALMNADLRGVGRCGPEVAAAIPETAFGMPEPEEGDPFRELQETNRIRIADLGNPNRIALDLVVVQPAMLVMTDVWHPDWKVTLEGTPAELFRVNYLQRGVWCPAGEYRLVMSFRPSTLPPGLAAAGAGLGALGVLIFLAFRSRRRRGDEES